MTKKLKFKNEIFASVHESASALFSVGGIDKKTMEMFDEKCIAEKPIAAQLQKKIKKTKVSQGTEGHLTGLVHHHANELLVGLL